MRSRWNQSSTEWLGLKRHVCNLCNGLIAGHQRGSPIGLIFFSSQRSSETAACFSTAKLPCRSRQRCFPWWKCVRVCVCVSLEARKWRIDFLSLRIPAILKNSEWQQQRPQNYLNIRQQQHKHLHYTESSSARYRCFFCADSFHSKGFALKLFWELISGDSLSWKPSIYKTLGELKKKKKCSSVGCNGSASW